MYVEELSWGKLEAGGKNTSRLPAFSLQKYNCDLETQALDATRLACVDSIQHPAKYGQNIYTYVTKEIYDLDKKLLITNAVKQWYLPVVHYGLREPNNVYADPRLFTFANLAYDKQVAVGCAYKECPNPSTRGIATCFYNFVVPPNAQLWEHGKACAFDTDCTYSGYPGSTCNNGLCVRPGNTLPGTKATKAPFSKRLKWLKPGARRRIAPSSACHGCNAGERVLTCPIDMINGFTHQTRSIVTNPVLEIGFKTVLRYFMYTAGISVRRRCRILAQPLKRGEPLPLKSNSQHTSSSAFVPFGCGGRFAFSLTSFGPIMRSAKISAWLKSARNV
ncbi:hypothetical protein Y032_0101g3352 [Ancylostoma ceylanicum]|uniref:SCP domain-containing protein n=1 Tax=Ancylostoma ceylanicum TaxID=53326 RepID=A0A016THM7_9BILA|nr:hypothetical protein Y032_0101g3352 [Ancylostoma ceylanicum]